MHSSPDKQPRTMVQDLGLSPEVNECPEIVSKDSFGANLGNLKIDIRY